MPVWELNTLLNRIDKYLPHILYGVDGARAEQERPQRVDDATMIPGMQLTGSAE